jgi:hypothetical protein
MKKFVAVLLLVMAISLPVLAQVHGTDTTIPASSDATAASIYKLYRAPLAKASDTCSLTLSFTLVGQTTAGGATVADNAVSAGGLYCYYATHVLNGFESAPSAFSLDPKTGSSVIRIPGPNAPGGPPTVVVR